MTIHRHDNQALIDLKLAKNFNGVGQKNFLINGEMMICQRGNCANVDGSYVIDRWCVLKDGDTTCNCSHLDSGQADTGNGSYRSYASLGIGTGPITKKFGLLQIIESKRIQGWQTIPVNTPLSLSFKAWNKYATIPYIRAAVLVWSGTADAPTRDVVNAWNAMNSNPTLVTDWYYAHTPVRFDLTSGVNFKIENILIPADHACNNIAVFIWTDTDVTDNFDALYVTNVQLEESTIATGIEQREFGAELALCQRYFESSFRYRVEAVVANVTASDGVVMVATPNGASSFGTSYLWRVSKRTSAYTLRFLNAAGEGEWYWYTVAGASVSSAPTVNNKLQSGFCAYLNGDNTRTFASGSITCEDEL